MSKVYKSTGSWLDKSILVNGDKLKITSEAVNQPTTQGDTMQLVAKCHVKDKVLEDKFFSINSQSKNALIDRYGDDTINWIDKILTVNIEKTMIAGKRGIALYLIPENMILKESDDGYIYIGHSDSDSGNIRGTVERNPNGTIKPTKEEKQVSETPPWRQNENQIPYPQEEINIDDIPF